VQHRVTFRVNDFGTQSLNHPTQLVKSEKMALGAGTKKKALFTEERLQAPRYNFAD
jgi:hypothetical protein